MNYIFDIFNEHLKFTPYSVDTEYKIKLKRPIKTRPDLYLLSKEAVMKIGQEALDFSIKINSFR